MTDRKTFTPREGGKETPAPAKPQPAKPDPTEDK